MMGLFPGVFATGLASDRFGRRTTIIIASLLGSCSCYFTLISKYSVMLYPLGRVLMNGCSHGASVVGFVYILEMNRTGFEINSEKTKLQYRRPE